MASLLWLGLGVGRTRRMGRLQHDPPLAGPHLISYFVGRGRCRIVDGDSIYNDHHAGIGKSFRWRFVLTVARMLKREQAFAPNAVSLLNLRIRFRLV